MRIRRTSSAQIEHPLWRVESDDSSDFFFQLAWTCGVGAPPQNLCSIGQNNISPWRKLPTLGEPCAMMATQKPEGTRAFVMR